jgi:transcriptional antiterminator NusG
MSNELLDKVNEQINNAPFDWVLIQVSRNKENSIRHRLRNEAASADLLDLIPEIVVLEEPRIRIKDDGTKEYQNINVLPGHILVNMDIYDEELLALIRRCDGIIGFNGNRYIPVPLSKEDALKYFLMAIPEKALGETPAATPTIEVAGETVGAKSSGTKTSTGLVVGDVVSVLDGPFEGMTGSISEIELEHERAQVLITAFGRETPVDLKLNQIRKQAN